VMLSSWLQLHQFADVSHATALAVIVCH